MTASNTPDQTIDEILVFVASTPMNETTYSDKKMNEAKAALKSLFETMMAEVVGEDVVPANERSVNWTDNNLKADQRQRIPQVISKYFNTEEK